MELHNREFGPWPVFLGGISMGATTVLLSAGEALPENVRGIVADCGFSSPWEIMAAVGRARVHLPPFPVLYLVKFWCRLLGGFDVKENSTTRAMQRNRLPVFLVHGEADHFVPCAMTQAAYDAAVCEKELLLVPGAGHGRSGARPRWCAGGRRRPCGRQPEVALGCGPAGAAAVAAGRLGQSRRGRRAVTEGDGAQDRGGQR